MAISKRGSSAPRPSPVTISWLWAANRQPRKPARCAPREKPTSSRTATSCIFFSTPEPPSRGPRPSSFSKYSRRRCPRGAKCRLTPMNIGGAPSARLWLRAGPEQVRSSPDHRQARPCLRSRWVVRIGAGARRGSLGMGHFLFCECGQDLVDEQLQRAFLLVHAHAHRGVVDEGIGSDSLVHLQFFHHLFGRAEHQVLLE